MENPAQDIYKVVELINSIYSPDLQKAAVEKYFLPDAAFKYPLYAIEPGLNSRKMVLGMYQWLHIISPHTKGTIHHVTYDKSRNILILDVTQHLHLRYVPFSPSSTKMLTRLTLKKQSGLHYISMQEDFMHPDEIAGLLFPPIKAFVHIALVLSAIFLNLLVNIAQFLGVFRVSQDKEREIKVRRKERRRRKNGNVTNEAAQSAEEDASQRENKGKKKPAESAIPHTDPEAPESSVGSGQN